MLNLIRCGTENIGSVKNTLNHRSFYSSERELWNSVHKIYINLKKIKKLSR